MAGFIKKHCIEEVERKSVIGDVVGQFVTLKKKGKDLQGLCPFHEEKSASFSVSPAKGIYKCFGCGASGVGAVSFIMKYKKVEYVEAVKWLAEFYNVELEYEAKEIKNEASPLPLSKGEGGATGDKTNNLQSGKKATSEVVVNNKKVVAGDGKVSFRDKQLASSGLTEKDQKYKRVRENLQGPNDYVEIDRYVKGSISAGWEVTDGDDMILYYYGLDGKQMTYRPEKKNKDLPFFRVRWSNPDAHLDKHKKAIKYQSPYDSGSHLWINQTVRTCFVNNVAMDTLFITEGEKKADKMTKHGMMAVGVGGINNIAYKQQLPAEFQWIIQACGVKRVVFVVDADWDDLSTNLTKSVDGRPRQFLAALRSFIDYFATFNNLGIFLDLYFAYPKKEHGVKGIDDAMVDLVGLQGKEKELVNDFTHTMNEANGKGKYIDCIKVSGFSEYHLRELFHLHDPKAFVEKHIDVLKALPVFQYGKQKFRIDENNEMVLAQPISEEEQYWEEKVSRSGVSLKFNNTGALKFLHSRGFYRYKIQSKNAEVKFIQINNTIVREAEPMEIRDYILDFTENALQNPMLLEFLYEKHVNLLGENSFSLLKFGKPTLLKNGKGLQYQFFEETFWRITKDGVEEKPLNQLSGHVWAEKLIDFNPKLQEPLMKVVCERDERGRPHYTINHPNKAGADACHFLRFLEKTSNFYWSDSGEGCAKSRFPNKKFRGPNELEQEDRKLHLLSKCTAIGYLLHRYFDASNTKAIVAMDGKMSEVGQSQGRSGKSLIGMVLRMVMSTVMINGKRKDLAENNFWLQNVTETTDIVFIDDIRVNFDMEHIFPNITGIWEIEQKGKQAITLAKETSPKFYIPTNHAINGKGGSFSDRQFTIAFSDYFNEDYKPVDEFGCLFIDEWDYEQRNLCQNLLANCLQIYFEHGLIKAPMDKIEQRRMRQQIGENFMDWAELFYDEDYRRGDDNTANINRAMTRTECTNNFYETYPKDKAFVSIREFKHKLKMYCQYKGYVFNPGKAQSETQAWGGDDKRGGVEYFTVMKQGAVVAEDMPF